MIRPAYQVKIDVDGIEQAILVGPDDTLVLVMRNGGGDDPEAWWSSVPPSLRRRILVLVGGDVLATLASEVAKNPDLLLDGPTSTTAAIEAALAQPIEPGDPGAEWP